MTSRAYSRSFGALVRLFRREVLRDPFLLEVKRWFRDRGDVTLRLDYPLSPDSKVLDLGGFRGDFAAAIHEKFGCKVFVFEPMPQFYRQCCERFSGNPAIRCFDFGLSGANGTFEIAEAGDASSFERDVGEKGVLVQANVRSVAEVWRELDLGAVDLVKINIEGGEYDVVPALVEAGLMNCIGHLQVQFHDFIDGAHGKREAIRSRVAATHDEMWNYEFVWESWRKR